MVAGILSKGSLNDIGRGSEFRGAVPALPPHAPGPVALTGQNGQN